MALPVVPDSFQGDLADIYGNRLYRYLSWWERHLAEQPIEAQVLIVAALEEPAPPALVNYYWTPDGFLPCVEVP